MLKYKEILTAVIPPNFV